jgi:2-keto-4-pentenoate hydratase/2-oxohepta-3-ene-1,7-dioic acid hydratase in catechol pathway
VQLANSGDRAQVMRGAVLFDLERASGGRFPSDPQAIYGQWDAFVAWGSNVDWDGNPPVEAKPVVPSLLGPPSPRPAQVFAVGLNYHSHAMEANLAIPGSPVVFTKFPSCLTGPYSDVPLPSGTIDWEVELVVVVGRESSRLTEADAWSHVAGVSVGQDISDRAVQSQPPVPQFSLAKSFTAFGPFGPAVVSVAGEIQNPDDLEVSCSVNGEEVQKARTSDLIFSVPELMTYISSVVTMYPGDVVFTGTPSGVGGAREPKWFLRPGDIVESHIEGVGTLQNTCIAGLGRRSEALIDKGSAEERSP